MKFKKETVHKDIPRLYEMVYGRTLRHDREMAYKKTRKDLVEEIDPLCIIGDPTTFSNDKLNKRTKALKLVREKEMYDTENLVSGALDKVEIPVEEEKKKKIYAKKPYNAVLIPILQKINSNTKDTKEKKKIQAIIRDLSANEKKMQLRKRKPEVNNN